MKKIKITYSWHENIATLEQQTSSFAIEVEDELFAECVAQQVPYRFNLTKTRRQSHIAMLAYWHAAMHDRYVLKDDEILAIQAEPEARFQTFSPD